MANKKIKLTLADKIIKSICFLLTLFWILCLVFPIYWMVVSSMKDSTAQYAKVPQLGITIPYEYTAVIDYDGDVSSDEMFLDANIVLWKMFEKVDGNVGGAKVIATVNGQPQKSFELSKASRSINIRLLFNKSIIQSRDIIQTVKRIKELDCVKVTEKGVKMPKVKNRNKFSKEMMAEYAEFEEIKGTIKQCTYQKNASYLFDNYKIAWDYPNRLGLEKGLFQPIINTLFIAIMTFVLSTLIASLSAYSVSKLLTRSLKTKIMTIVLISGMVSPTLLLIQQYQVVNTLELTNSFWGVILPSLANFGAMLLYKVQFDAFPDGIIEAARLDGANEMRIYLTMVLPSAKALIAYNALTGFAATWGDFFWPMMILRDPEKYNLGIVINILLNGSGNTPDYAVTLAFGFLISIPTLVIYAIFQKQLNYNLGGGAIKG